MTDTYNIQPPQPIDSFPFVERSGLTLLHAERGRAVVRMPLEGNVNHVGMMYAGALFTAAEIPGGTVFASAFDMSRFYPIIGELSIRYTRPASGDVTVEVVMSDAEIERVTAELEDKGRSKFVLETEITDDDGNVVAKTAGTYFGLSF